jgi:hypothetical protein
MSADNSALDLADGLALTTTFWWHRSQADRELPLTDPKGGDGRDVP